MLWRRLWTPRIGITRFSTRRSNERDCFIYLEEVSTNSHLPCDRDDLDEVGDFYDADGVQQTSSVFEQNTTLSTLLGTPDAHAKRNRKPSDADYFQAAQAAAIPTFPTLSEISTPEPVIAAFVLFFSAMPSPVVWPLQAANCLLRGMLGV